MLTAVQSVRMRRMRIAHSFFEVSRKEVFLGKYENSTRQNKQIVRIKFDRIGHIFIFFETMLEFFC